MINVNEELFIRVAEDGRAFLLGGNKPRLTEAYISEPEAQLAPDRVDLWGHDTELKALSSALTTDDIILVC